MINKKVKFSLKIISSTVVVWKDEITLKDLDDYFDKTKMAF